MHHPFKPAIARSPISRPPIALASSTLVSGMLLSGMLLASAIASAPAIAQNPAPAARDDASRDAKSEARSIPADAQAAVNQAAVNQAEFLGRQLYLHDRAAWLATDAMLADRRMRKLKKSIGGWVTEPTAHGLRVIFFDKGEAPRRLYEVEVDEAERISEATIESTTPLTAEHLAQIRARKLALSQSFAPCAQNYNSVILPSADGLRVYLMPAFPEAGVYPLGGYHRFGIDAAGEKILASRKFTETCIFHSDRPKGGPAGYTPKFGAFTHLLDPQPTEIHVFVSLYAKLPLMIMTVENRRIWSVVEGKIEFVE